MIWQLSFVVLCVIAAGVWMKHTWTATERAITELDQLLTLLAARDAVGLRAELRNAAKRFADDPPTATVLSELADGLLTIDEIFDQWEEQKIGSEK